jgi:methionine-rich copper-binding protein CopC
MSTTTHNQHNFQHAANEVSVRGKFASRLKVPVLKLLVASMAVFGLQLSGASFANATGGLTLTSADPSDDDINVSINKTIVLTFSDDIDTTTGQIAIYETGTGTAVLFESFTVESSPLITISGDELTINPTNPMSNSTEYFINIDASAIITLGDPTTDFDGITDATTLNFTTVAAADTTPPTLSSSSPADNVTGVAVASNIALTFSENVETGTGVISIYETGTGTAVLFESFTVESSPLITISGGVLTINPTASMANSTQYYVTVDSTAVEDLAGNTYAGISSTTALNFTTVAAADTTPPTLSSSSPADNVTGVAVASNIALTFSENVETGTGVISIYETGTGTAVLFESFTVESSPLITISGGVLTINPTASMANSTQYYVTVDSTAVEDLAGNTYAGISSTTALNFTTVAAKSAAIANVDVAGTAGSAITPVEAVVTLTADTFNAISINDNLASWVTNEPSGITVKSKTAVSIGSSTVTLVFEGTPAAAVSAAMAITIPSAALGGGANLAVTANANAKFTVAAAALSAPTVTGVAITGTAQVGVELTAAGTIGGGTAATTDYLWEISANGTSGWSTISGATTNKYTPVSGDATKFIRATITVTNATGSDDDTSAATSAVAAAAVSAPAPTPAEVSLATQSAITVSVPASLEVGKTATLTTTGGATTGTNNFLSNSPTICTVTGAGVVTAVAAGTCSVYAQRTASGFTTAVSADVTFKVLTAAEVKAVADAAAKAAADKAAADALAAAEKAAADKAAAEAKAKEAAEMAAAEAARVEAVRLAGLSTVGNIKTVKGKTSISMNLADKYYAYILELQVRTVVKGKARFTTIEYFAVEREDGVVTVSTRAKIAKGQQMRVLSDGKVVRTFIR